MRGDKGVSFLTCYIGGDKNGQSQRSRLPSPGVNLAFLSEYFKLYVISTHFPPLLLRFRNTGIFFGKQSSLPFYRLLNSHVTGHTSAS